MSGHPAPNARSRTLANMSAEERTKTALGPAAGWYGMYNPSPGNVMPGALANDNRAQGGGMAGWGNPRGIERKRWDEKYVGEPIAGSSPTAWIESKRGMDADTMAKLLRQKEKGEEQATASEWKDGMPDSNHPEYIARVPASPFVKTRPSPLSQRLTLTERAEGKTRSRVGVDTSPVGNQALDEFVAYVPGSTRGMPPAPSEAQDGSSARPAPYYLQGTQRGYAVDVSNREQYWTMANRPHEASGSIAGGQMEPFDAPKAGIAAAQQLAFYEGAREARVAELTEKLGIDKVKTTSGRVDTTPKAGHHTAVPN